MSERAARPMQPRGAARPSWLLALLAPLTVAAVVAVLILAVTGEDEAPTAAREHSAVGLAAPPLELTTVSGDVAAHYLYAADHEAAYGQIPCYCGCREFLAHRSLFDCFVRPDGAGWDAHAAGCAVCIGESTLARTRLDAGDDALAVRASVIAQFGTTPSTTPPQT